MTAFSLLRNLLETRRSLQLPVLEIRKLQEKKLRAIIKHAYDNVPFYRRKFEDAGITPQNIQTIADMEKVPMTSKDEIQASLLEDVTAKGVCLSNCEMNTTSGSTGVPLTTYVNKEAKDFYRAVWLVVFLHNGVRLWDKKAIIEDPRNFPKKNSWNEYLRIMDQKHISVFDDPDTQLKTLEEYYPNIIQGYPSSLQILARSYINGKVCLEPRLLFTLAETLDKESRKFISSAFDAELFDYYGSSEFSLMAWECNEHTGYHINADCVLIEFIRDGKPVGAGERGEITCTSLVNYAMPLIRYRIGDIGVPIDDKCPCGVSLPRIKAIEGRADDFLMTLNGRIISPTIFFPYPFKDFRGIRQFRVIQEKRDRLKFQIVADHGFLPAEALESATSEIKQLFGEAMSVEFELTDEIPKEFSGKLKKIISYVPVSFN